MNEMEKKRQRLIHEYETAREGYYICKNRNDEINTSGQVYWWGFSDGMASAMGKVFGMHDAEIEAIDKKVKDKFETEIDREAKK